LAALDAGGHPAGVKPVILGASMNKKFLMLALVGLLAIGSVAPATSSQVKGAIKAALGIGNAYACTPERGGGDLVFIR
jgi:hypothetical protein